LTTGEADDKIGAEAAREDVSCSEKSAVRSMSAISTTRRSWSSPQAAGEGGGAKGGGELVGLGLKLELGGAEGFELFTERAIGGGAGFFDFGDLAVHLFEGIAERFDEGVDGELAFFEVAGGFGLELGERLAGLLKEVGALARRASAERA